MTFNEFADKNIGKIYSYREFDCEYIVIEGLKEIYDITVNKLVTSDLLECDKSEAIMFICEDKKGTQCHTGLYDRGVYLHAVGSPFQEGQVFAHTNSFFNRVFVKQYSKVRFYKWR